MSFAQALVTNLGFIPYGEKESEGINSLRSKERLCADVLLGTVANHYPPRSVDGLLALVAATEGGDLSRIAQARALYYIFIDFPEDRTGGESVAEYYASEIGLATRQRRLVRGLWLLDHGEFTQAVAALGEPWQSTVEDPDAVVALIIRALQPRPELLIAFVDAQTTLLEGPSLEHYVRALAAQRQAFRVLELARSRSDSHLLELLGGQAADDRALARVVAQLPTNADEWDVIRSALGTSDLGRELRMMRALHVGDLPTISELKEDPRFDLVAAGTADL